MRVLHLFGDWKWTGPAEPTLDLCLELRSRGVDALLLCPPAPAEASTNLPAAARERGLEPRHGLRFNRRINLFDNLSDVASLRDLCDAEKVDLLHVHFSQDHLLGGLAARRARVRPQVVRTNQKAIPTKRGPGSSFLLRRLTDSYLTYSKAALEADTKSFGLNGRARLIPPALRLERFDPSISPVPARARFGLDSDHFVLGVVARMQRHRRFDVLLEGVKRARVPGLRVLVIGRGTNMNEVAVEPARRLGLDNVVTFTGYLGKDYLATVAAFDALLFLVPGSDGTCRALREAMAMGKPVIGARRGMIPELVDDGRSGLVIDDTPENIALAIERLAASRDERREMGKSARARAVEGFDIRRQADAVIASYEETLRRRA
ncbi:MAG TPA: glycosyltransferase family 4 protein [Planctomycetota bacterium]|nr:glycosyltransferase family 4 protein [Planctomycetota bacterium]